MSRRKVPTSIVFTQQELNRLTGFFALLIQIDRRVNANRYQQSKTSKKKKKIGEVRLAKVRALFFFLISLSLTSNKNNPSLHEQFA